MAGGDPQAALIHECNRQSENCAYTASTFIIWLRVLRIIRVICVIAPIIFGAFAAWKVMADSPGWAATWVVLATAIRLLTVHQAQTRQSPITRGWPAR
jgi:hypothetical protein